MEPKFKIGDNVRIVKYGHLQCCHKERFLDELNMLAKIYDSLDSFLLTGGKMSDEEISLIPNRYFSIEQAGYSVYKQENDEWIYVDFNKDLIGKECIIVGISDGRYSLHSDTHMSWFNEDQLELIK